MNRGHVTGTKVEKHGATNWYAEIEAANIQAVEDAERTLTTALAHQVGNAVTAMPEAASRITKAAALVQSKSVWPLTSGSYLVGSQGHPGRAPGTRKPSGTVTASTCSTARTCAHMPWPC